MHAFNHTPYAVVIAAAAAAAKPKWQSVIVPPPDGCCTGIWLICAKCLTGGGREFSPHQFNVGYTSVRCPMLDFISIGYARALAQCPDVAPLHVHIYVLFSARII